MRLILRQAQERARQEAEETLTLYPTVWFDTIDPSTIPDDVLKSERARRNVAKRKTFGGGRPRKPRCACGLYTRGVAKKRHHVCQQAGS